MKFVLLFLIFFHQSSFDPDSDSVNTDFRVDCDIVFTKEIDSSKRKNDLLFDNLNNKYTIKRKDELNDIIIWRCSIRSPHCPAIVYEDLVDGSFEIIHHHSATGHENVSGKPNLKFIRRYTYA